MILLVADARAQWAELDRRISAFDAEFVRWVKENEEGSPADDNPRRRRDRRIRPCRRSRPSWRASSAVAIWRRGSASFRVSSRPAVSRSCSGSASAATNTYADSWIHGARGAAPMWLSATRRSADGRRDSQVAPPSQRCDRRLRQQAGKHNPLGGAAARRTICRHRNAPVAA